MAKNRTQFEEYLEQRAKEKQKKPEIYISTKIECDWEFFLVKLFKKLFRKGE